MKFESKTVGPWNKTVVGIDMHEIVSHVKRVNLSIEVSCSFMG